MKFTVFSLLFLSLGASAESFSFRPFMTLERCEPNNTCYQQLVSRGSVRVELKDGLGTWTDAESQDGIDFKFSVVVRNAGPSGYQLVTTATVSHEDSRSSRFSTYTPSAEKLQMVSTYTDSLPVKTYGFSAYIAIEAADAK
jgi:hypothetical protein